MAPAESTDVQEIRVCFVPVMGEVGRLSDEPAVQAEPGVSTVWEGHATPAITPAMVLIEPQAADEAPLRPDVVVVCPLALPPSAPVPSGELLTLDYRRLQAIPECDLTQTQLKILVVDQFWQLASQGGPLTYYCQVPVQWSTLLLALLPMQFYALHTRLDRLEAQFPDGGLSVEQAERERQLASLDDWLRDALSDWQTTFHDLEPEIWAWRQALREDLRMIQTTDAGGDLGM